MGTLHPRPEKIERGHGIAVVLAISFLVTGCLQQPGVSGSSRSMGNFDHTNITGCVSCHSVDRPAGIVGTPGMTTFDHSTNGQGDCVSCHFPNRGQTWSGTQFPHNPMPKTCVQCHASERPTSGATFTAYDPATS